MHPFFVRVRKKLQSPLLSFTINLYKQIQLISPFTTTIIIAIIYHSSKVLRLTQTTLRSPISYVAACSKAMSKIIMLRTKCKHQSRNSVAEMSEDLNHALTSYQPLVTHKTTTYHMLRHIKDHSLFCSNI